LFVCLRGNGCKGVFICKQRDQLSICYAARCTCCRHSMDVMTSRDSVGNTKTAVAFSLTLITTQRSLQCSQASNVDREVVSKLG